MKKYKNRIITGVCVCAILLTLMFSETLMKVESAYYGAPDANMQKLENRLSSIKKEINSLQSKINSAKSNQTSELENKAYLDQQIKLTQDNIEITTELINTLSLDIEKKIEEIDDKSAEYDRKLENFKQRMRINHEEGEISYIDMLFGSANLSDFFERLDRVGCMIEYDKSIMQTITEDKAELEATKKEYEDTLARQIELKEELLLSEKELAEKAVQSANYLNALVADQAKYQSQLLENELAMDKVNKEIEEYAKQLEAQNTKYIGGEFMWPVPTNYTYVSSEYCWRNSPITGRRELHNGIDIPVAFGTNIYASNAGTVVISTWHNSYGYYVMIDHGGGYATLYAHNSKLLVSVGDYVERGQVIAKAGSTGDSTGNHCHFSMYEGGKTIDPRKYFPK